MKPIRRSAPRELQDFADLMVDEVIARVRVQLEAGQSLTIHDQKCMLEQLIKDRERRGGVAQPQSPSPDLSSSLNEDS